MTDRYTTTAQFRSTYAALGDFFARKVSPTPVAAPQWISLNTTLAAELGLETNATDEALAIFSGNMLPSWADSIAQAYAGHQFGHFVPQLGDGRAVLLSEVVAPQSGELFDIQLKGSGPTPFSRGGDGRSALGPVLREYLVSEAMHALGVPTSRALAAVASGEWVYREGALPGAVLTRVARSHLRVGTFQYAAAHGGPQKTKQLADYAIARHFPELHEIQPGSARYHAFFQRVVDAQIELVAQWQRIGFIHGVMNTDNTSICGDTIDFGPCAFMDTFKQDQVFSAIDRQGRYRYCNQPRIAHWNMARFGETLLPLIDENESAAVTQLTELLSDFDSAYTKKWVQVMAAKFGIDAAAHSGQAEQLADFIKAFLVWLENNERDFTLSFSMLTDCMRDEKNINLDSILRALNTTPTDSDFHRWIETWLSLLTLNRHSAIIERMQSANPRRIPRNHHIAAAITHAETTGDLTLFHRLLRSAQFPNKIVDEYQEFEIPPQPHERVTRTFCGT